MISKNARAIILKLLDHDLFRLHPSFDHNNDNDLTYFVFEFLGGIDHFEHEHGIEFYD